MKIEIVERIPENHIQSYFTEKYKDLSNEKLELVATKHISKDAVKDDKTMEFTFEGRRWFMNYVDWHILTQAPNNHYIHYQYGPIGLHGEEFELLGAYAICVYKILK